MCCFFLRGYWKELDVSFKIYKYVRKFHKFAVLLCLTTMIVGAILEIGNEKFAVNCPYTFDKYIPRDLRLYVGLTCISFITLKCMERSIPIGDIAAHVFHIGGICFLYIMKRKFSSTVYLLKYEIYMKLQEARYYPILYQAMEQDIMSYHLWLHNFNYDEYCYTSIFTNNVNSLLISSLVAWSLFVSIFLVSILEAPLFIEKMKSKFIGRFESVMTPPKLSTIDEEESDEISPDDLPQD